MPAARDALARRKGDRYLRRAETSPDESVLDRLTARRSARGDAAMVGISSGRSRKSDRTPSSSSPCRWLIRGIPTASAIGSAFSSSFTTVTCR